MKNKAVIVTGGSSGIGAAIVTRLLEAYNVILFDKDPTSLKHPDLSFIAGDVSNEEDVSQAFKEISAQFNQVYALINNAGISDKKSVRETPLQTWNRALSVNLTGPFLMAREFANCFQMAGLGVQKIINIASVSGMVGMPNYSAYNVSKAGLIELTKTMALEFAPGIHTTAICPGYILTPMQRAEYTQEELESCASTNPSRRLGDPLEVAELVEFLLSGRNNYFNGSIIVMDGGETAGGMASQ